MQDKISFKDKIYIAGSSGMAGRAIKNALLEAGYGKNSFGGEILTTKRSELDLLDSKLVNEWLEQNKPDVVVLAAAKV